jgi:GNAT superfamily N-acetyltransferase
MSPAPALNEETILRARAWRTASLAAICDVLEPWEHGTIARATAYPSYFDFNVVRMETDAALSVGTLLELTDRALGELSHRRLDFDSAALGRRLRATFEAEGWKTARILWMRHEAELPEGPDIPVQAVEYDEVHHLRVMWHEEDPPGVYASPAFYRHAREVALALGARVLAVRDRGRPVAYVQLETHGGGAEISHVYVDPDHRGAGLGTALTRAAIQAGHGHRDLWISADDEDRPKNLYARLGFRPIWTAMQFTRLPEPVPAPR